MKKITVVFSVLILIAISISACNASEQVNPATQQGTSIANADTDNSSGDDTGIVENTQVPATPGSRQRLADGEIPLAMKITLGTFLLEGTDYPINAEQAAELLPLWKALRSLSESETTAAEEIQALLNQIQDTLTPEQIATMDSMDPITR